MANSLNQAFIRAYAKERETAHSRAVVSQEEAKAAEQQAVEDLIQRFDTATVQIPTPHLLAKQPARERVAVHSSASEAKATRGRTAARPQPSESPVVDPLAAESQATESQAVEPEMEVDELRIRIANSMLRASDFQSEQIASLNSFIKFPTASMASSSPQPAASKFTPPTADVSQYTSILAQPSQPSYEQSARSEPQAVVPQAVVPQAVVPQAVVPQAVVPQAVDVQPTAPNIVTPQAVVPQAANQEHSKPTHDSQIASTPTTFEPIDSNASEPDAEIMESIPLPVQGSSPKPVAYEPSQPASEMPTSETVNSVFNKAGTIFRVDNPGVPSTPPVARTAPQPVIAPVADASSFQSVSEPAPERTSKPTIFYDNSVSQSRHRPAVERDEAHHAEQVAEAKQVEKRLRKAKVRIFNPVWEVDQLQWPSVCLQLMEAKTESLSQVAKHLVDACQEGLQVLAVTSPEGGEGRTTVACCLARLAASRGLKTAIVDGDVEKPTLCLQTNLEIEKDWQSALLNQVPLEEIAVHSIDDQITLLPLLGPVDQEELPVDDLRIVNMLSELSESFDLVIVDMGHMSSPNGLMISLSEQGIVNAAIAVVDHRSTTTQRIETCIRRIRQAGVHSIGLVENFAA